MTSNTVNMHQGNLPHKKSGAGLLCGLYALAGAFADSKNPNITDRDERELQAQQIFDQLSGIFNGDEFLLELMKHCNEKKYPKAVQMELANTDCFLTDDHIRVLAKMYADQCGKTCHLNIETQHQVNGEILSARWFEFGGSTDVFEITLRNRWNSHWEPVIRVLDVNDISVDGSPLDKSSKAPTENKFQSSAIGLTVAADKTTVTTDEGSIAEESSVAKESSVAAEEEEDISDPNLAEYQDHMGNEVTERTKLVPLIIPRKGSLDWHNVSTCPPHSCQLITSSGMEFSKDKMPTPKDLAPYLEEGMLYNHRSANLSICFGSLELNPWLEVQLVIYRSNRKTLAEVWHKSSLRFFFGRLLLPAPENDPINAYVTIDGISDLRFETSQKNDKYLLSFGYQYAVPHNLTINASTEQQLTKPEKEVTLLHQCLAKPTGRRTVSFLVHRSPKEIYQGADDDFHLLLQKVVNKQFPGLTRDPYTPYLSKNGFVNIQANSFKTRMKILKDGSPHMPVSARVEFADLIEAGVQVGFFTDLANAEDEARRVQYERSSHQARFINVGSFVLVLLKLVNKDAMFDARHLLDPHTEILLSWTDITSNEISKALTFLAHDFFQSLPGADIVLISKTKGVKYFGKIAVPLSKLNSAKVFDVKVKLTPNNSTYLRMVDAIALVWDPRDGRRDLWPLLLNHFSRDLKPISVFAKAKVSKEASEAALKNVTQLPKIPLNDSQLRVVHGSKTMTGGLQLVQAPGGTGKTTTLSLLTEVYQQTQICTLLCAPTNTAVNELCMRYTEIFGKDFAPLRIFATDSDHENTVLGINCHEGVVSDESIISDDIITLEVVHSMLGAPKVHHRLITGSDLLSRSLERAKSKKYVLMQQYIDGQDEEGQPRYYGPSLNMYEELLNFHEKAQDPTQEPFFEWSDDDKRNYKQALQYIKEDVIRSASIIGTTTNGIGRKILRQNAGISEMFRGIVIIIDEASRESEASFYVAMTKLTAYSKIVGVHMIGDVRQGLPVVTFNRATKPKTTGSTFTNEAYNEFFQRGHVSLFARLISQGFPVLSLDVQYRMHPTILDFPNRQFYDASLSSGQIVRSRLDPELIKLCRGILNIDATVPSNQIRLQWIEIEPSQMRRSQKSHSRANLETRNWIQQAMNKLRPYFKQKMSESVAIISPYRRQVEEYTTANYRLRQASVSDSDEPLSSTAITTVRTVDNVQGGEWDFVILDLVISNADRIQDIGHISDDHRACVALTRAKKVFWVVSGRLQGRLLEQNPDKRLCAILACRQDIVQKDRLITIEPVASDNVIPEDLLLPNELLKPLLISHDQPC